MEFGNDGKSLHVYGKVFTHISSHLAPMHADFEEVPLRPLARILHSVRTWATSTSGKADWCLRMMGLRGTRFATEVIRPQTELSMFISVLYDAFSRMTIAERLRSQKQLTALMIVARRERSVESELWMWWRTLRTSAGNIQGREWLENIMSTNTCLQNSNTLVMNILQEEGLSAVFCEANESLASPGGLAFTASAAQTGDVVALVSGVAFPLVLRPAGQGHFRLVGPLFLPGVMDGELKDKVMTITLDDIVLV